MHENIVYWMAWQEYQSITGKIHEQVQKERTLYFERLGMQIIKDTEIQPVRNKNLGL